jgi:hypothetical protein
MNGPHHLSGECTLAALLDAIEESDTAYESRYPLVLGALYVATQLGWPAGVRIDPAQPEWPVAYIETPEGQVSWHLPQHGHEWDGHSTEEKYRRVRAWLATHEQGHRELNSSLARQLAERVAEMFGNGGVAPVGFVLVHKGDEDA